MIVSEEHHHNPHQSYFEGKSPRLEAIVAQMLSTDF